MRQQRDQFVRAGAADDARGIEAVTLADRFAQSATPSRRDRMRAGRRLARTLLLRARRRAERRLVCGELVDLAFRRGGAGFCREHKGRSPRRSGRGSGAAAMSDQTWTSSAQCAPSRADSLALSLLTNRSARRGCRFRRLLRARTSLLVERRAERRCIEACRARRRAWRRHGRLWRDQRSRCPPAPKPRSRMACAAARASTT